MKKELWLEFGYKMKPDYEDMLWYNEGRWQQWKYFVKNFLEFRKDKRPMYFKIRYGKLKVFLRNDRAVN